MTTHTGSIQIFRKLGATTKAFLYWVPTKYYVPPYKSQSLQQLGGEEFCAPALHNGMWSHYYASIVMPNSYFRDSHVPINSWSNIFHRVSIGASTMVISINNGNHSQGTIWLWTVAFKYNQGRRNIFPDHECPHNEKRALVILEIVCVVIFLSLQQYMSRTVAVELYKHLWGPIL
jgi:hypothetical protein